jgi:CubicO group peptidase (beta-lactamase class C family)
MKRAYKKTTVLLFILCFILASCAEKQVDKSLPRSVPEAEGISSKAIITFLDSAATNTRTEFHSFMLLRHGKVIAEGWWDPYRPDLIHTMYSASKSFTSTAVGFAVKEKKLSIEDKIISFFPDKLPDSISPYLEQLKVKHLLMMSTGQRREPPTTTQDWVKSYLETPVEIEPGTRYRYSSLATFMLSAIVQKVSGQKVIDYLTPRLFEPLGIEGIDWETAPGDINTGGWGLRVKTEDMAKLGQLYLNKGKWNGKQLLPEKWVEEATSLKIQQRPEFTQSKRDSSLDDVQGYCYQFWRARHNSYQANGAFGQFILIIPEKDAVVVLTANSNDMWGELDMVWKYLYPAMKDDPLPADEESAAFLKQRLASLALPVPPKSSNEEITSKISGKTFTLSENNRHIQSLTFEFRDDKCLLNMKTDTASFDMVFGAGKWEFGETLRHGPSIFATAVNSLNGLPPFKVAGAYTWKEDQSLELTLRYIESVHNETMNFRFEGNKIFVDFPGAAGGPGFKKIPPIEGSIQE